ncbi:hypothetical protein MUG84_08725 [Paenibacillus sp. KQZ6P-2]|uniref:Uncharacterized protein n=1 Tax=Paenibacillus mangrovi TaxID=2931978 RepID=A0A9X1WR26_9BACL|nr:hypothetical protein [Paenibacillus mangrovi]MCJ8011825.1 hypothetical protein [Paenibacillus mangrovi]
MKNSGKGQKKMTFWADETGEFGVKQIAVTVAVIVIIGMIVTVVRTNLGTWVGEIWSLFMKQIQDLIS